MSYHIESSQESNNFFLQKSSPQVIEIFKFDCEIKYLLYYCNHKVFIIKYKNCNNIIFYWEIMLVDNKIPRSEVWTGRWYWTNLSRNNWMVAKG